MVVAVIFLSSFSFVFFGGVGGWGGGSFCCRFFGRLVRYPVLCLQAINDSQQMALRSEQRIFAPSEKVAIPNQLYQQPFLRLRTERGGRIRHELREPRTGSVFQIPSALQTGLSIQDYTEWCSTCSAAPNRVRLALLYGTRGGGGGARGARPEGGGYDREGLASSRTGKNKHWTKKQLITTSANGMHWMCSVSVCPSIDKQTAPTPTPHPTTLIHTPVITWAVILKYVQNWFAIKSYQQIDLP